MNNKSLNKLANELTEAFLKNKIIKSLPLKITKKLIIANKFRKICEEKITDPVIGYKAGGTSIPLLKKLKEKEPFYASIFKRNLLQNGAKVKINKSNLGIELEVCYLIKKSFFKSKNLITKNNINKFISHIAPCIEIVGYRQRKYIIKTLGDLSSDFGANVKFIIGRKIKYKNSNVSDLKSKIICKKLNHIVNGNTNTVYVNPLNSLKFILNKLKKDKVQLNKNFYVFTGSTIGVVPILGKGSYVGNIENLGSVKAIIN